MRSFQCSECVGSDRRPHTCTLDGETAPVGCWLDTPDDPVKWTAVWKEIEYVPMADGIACEIGVEGVSIDDLCKGLGDE